MITIDLVREYLSNAKENGHTFEGWTDKDVALDLKDCCADAEDVELAELTLLVNQARSNP